LNLKDNIRRVDDRQPQDAVIAEAARIICSGGVVIFPTTGLYGLAADAFNSAAVDKVFAVKQRPPDKPILILVSNIGQIRNLVREIPPAAEQLMTAFWPGKLTLVFKAGNGLLPGLTAGTGKIGIRLPVHPVARHLVHAVGRPITATSANLSGQTGCSRISDIDPAIAGAVDLILDAGPLEGGAGSTILDVTQYPPVILRDGAIPKSLIFSIRSKRPQTG
jgi:L-threonylcarbamoyladenylate synthase